MPRVANTSNINNPKRYGYDVQLDNIYLRTATAPGRELVIQSSDINTGNQINVKQNPEDFTSNLGRIYSRNNFKAGQGLDTAHRLDAQESDVHRFWDSKGVDVFHGDDETSYNIHLLHTMADKNVRGADTTFNSTNNYMTQTTNGDIYVTDEDDLYKSTDNGDTWAAQTTGATHNFTGITSVGNRVFATTANGTSGSQLIEWDGSAWQIRTTAQSSAAGLNGIWFVKGTLIISGDDGELERVWAISPFEQTWSATDLQDGDKLFSFEDTHHISQVIDAGAVILAASTDGNVYSIKDQAGTWLLKGVSNIPFEEVHSISAVEGLVFLGTKEYGRNVGRFYSTELVVADDLYVLANRQLVKEWVNGVDTTPKFMFASRDSVYCGVKEDDSETCLWRYYLPTGGIARDLCMAGEGFVTGITNSDNKFIVVMAGVDVFKETSQYESEGYLITSAADFFTAEEKQFVGAEISTLDLPDNTEVELLYSTSFEDLDNPTSTRYTTAITQIGGTGDDEHQIAEVSRYIIGKVVLKSTDNVDTPKVKSIQFRALARPELVVVQIPVNISDRVERPGRRPLKVKGLGDALYSSLRNKEGNSVTVEIFEPNEIIKGVVEQISYPVQSNDVTGSDTLYAMITIRGTRQTRLTDVTSIHVTGISAFGIMRYGA